MSLKTPHVRTKKVKDPDNLGGIGRGLNAHALVVKTAIAFAHELFEVYMLDNDWWHKMSAGGKVSEKDGRRLFVQCVAPLLLEDARDALVDALNTDLPQAQKDQIAEALILDNGLRGKRVVSERRATLH